MMRRLILTALFAALATSSSAATGDACAPILANAAQGAILETSSGEEDRRLLECAIARLPDFRADLTERRATFKFRGGTTEYLSLVEAMRDVIRRGGRPAINYIRERDSIEFAATLAAGARHPDYALRIASSYVLSNVIDNPTMCGVIDYLHADVAESRFDNPDIYGRANLVYVLNAIVLWAKRENVSAIQRTVSKINAKIRTLSSDEQANLGSTEKGLNNLAERMARITDGTSLKTSEGTAFAKTPLSDEERAACREHDYRFWRDGSNPYRRY